MNNETEKYIYNDHNIIYAFKMLGNDTRFKILEAIYKNPGVTIEQISSLIEVDFKTVSFHARKLYQAKLLQKKTKNPYVHHYLNNYGKNAIRCFYSFSKIKHE
jgi:predicted transcriptional regulator